MRLGETAFARAASSPPQAVNSSRTDSKASSIQLPNASVEPGNATFSHDRVRHASALHFQYLLGPVDMRLIEPLCIVTNAVAGRELIGYNARITQEFKGALSSGRY